MNTMVMDREEVIPPAVAEAIVALRHIDRRRQSPSCQPLEREYLDAAHAALERQLQGWTASA